MGEQPVITPGDRVEVLAGARRGEVGTVTAILNDTQHHVWFDDGGPTVPYEAWELQRVGRLGEE